jgi:hypothetical protein
MKLLKAIPFDRTIMCACGKEGCYRAILTGIDGEIWLYDDKSDRREPGRHFQFPEGVAIAKIRDVPVSKASRAEVYQEMGKVNKRNEELNKRNLALKKGNDALKQEIQILLQNLALMEARIPPEEGGAP